MIVNSNDKGIRVVLKIEICEVGRDSGAKMGGLVIIFVNRQFLPIFVSYSRSSSFSFCRNRLSLSMLVSIIIYFLFLFLLEFKIEFR